MNYKNELGQSITDEQLDEMIADIENEDFTAFEPVSELTYKRIEPKGIEQSIVSVQFPIAMKNELVKIADKNGCTISELIRSYTFDGIEKSNVIV